MSDLRSRIAAVIRREVPCHQPAADRIADAVIREVLTPQWIADIVLRAVTRAEELDLKKDN